MGPVIATESLTKKYKSKVVVNRLDLRVPGGSIYGFLGPNGAGKSTTLKMLLGLVKPTAGNITILGKEVTPKNRLGILSSTGSLIESPAYYGHLSGKENLQIICTLKNLPETEIPRVLQIVRMKDQQNKKVSQYSLGMKQRLGIAQALLADPKLLICDEPTSALDPVGRKEILDILYKIRGTTTVLFSTHILSDVERICDHVALLNDGNIAVGGTLSEIKALHSHDSLLIEFSTEADLQYFKECMTEQSFLNGSEEKGREIVIHSRNMKKAQHTIFSTLAEADIAPVKVELMEPSLESLFLEVIK